MTKNEVHVAFMKLSLNEQTELLRLLNEDVQRTARRQIRIGAQVSFTSRHGAKVEGIVEKINQKSIKVRANVDRFGFKTVQPVRWTVSPQLLTVI